MGKDESTHGAKNARESEKPRNRMNMRNTFSFVMGFSFVFTKAPPSISGPNLRAVEKVEKSWNRIC